MMRIDKPTSAEYAEFLVLVDAEIRPHRAKTHAWDDFPLILHDENRENMLIARSDDGLLAGGIASLTRPLTTNYGNIDVAGIGSVVTRKDFRGQGISRKLQEAMLEQLRSQGVPLAVLWTDQPEIYAGRGFVPAGWELHLDLEPVTVDPSEFPPGAARPLTAGDVDEVARLYGLHPCRTLREPGDFAILYAMPGTRGLVWQQTGSREGGGLGAVFCGKGADFPGYVVEWDGPADCVLPLLLHARDMKLASRVLVPAGEEALAEMLVNHGAGWEIRPAGLWCVLDHEVLCALTGHEAPLPQGALEDARFWLGGVDADGQVQPGVIKVGVWGFDSV